MTKRENEIALVILSGGMDSTTLLYDTISKGYKTFAISFDYGQKHKVEIQLASKTCKKLGINHKIVNVDVLNELAPSALTRKDWKVPEGRYDSKVMKQTVVPNRNMVLISLATSYAISIGAKKLFYGAHAGDHTIYPDCRKEFVKQLSKAVALCDWSKVDLYAPYLNMDKGDIALRGKILNVDYSLTRTCYTSGRKACGKCGACVERLEAFGKAKMEDPIEYEAGVRK